MAEQKRRTKIRIETHEITIIRFGRLQRIDPVNVSADAEVVALAEDPMSATTDEKEKENETQS
jgi:hypothetical protein